MTSVNPVKENLRTKEAATFLGFSERSLERWRSEGVGPPFFRIGRSYLYRRKDLDAYLRGDCQERE